jgi:hypothetical protein
VVDRRVPVSEAQVDAAKLIVERNTARARPTSDAIQTIAKASRDALDQVRLDSLLALTREAMTQTAMTAQMTESLIRDNPALEPSLRAIQEQSLRQIQRLIEDFGRTTSASTDDAG